MEPVLDLEMTNLAEAEARLYAGLESFTRGLTIASHAQALAVARQLGENLQRQFRQRGHDKSSGISEDDLGRKATVNDVEVYPTAFGAVCSAGPVWTLLQFGSKRHYIDVHEGTEPPYLHFKGSRGWAMVKRVDHPGYRGDDMLGRAVAELDLTEFSVTVVSEAYAGLLSRLK